MVKHVMLKAWWKRDTSDSIMDDLNVTPSTKKTWHLGESHFIQPIFGCWNLGEQRVAAELDFHCIIFKLWTGTWNFRI